MSSLDLAMIGNCSIAALLDHRARLVWCCLPRFDSDPTFCALVNGGSDEHGVFDIELFDLDRTEQFYRRNSAVLVTRLYDKRGGAIEITDRFSLVEVPENQVDDIVKAMRQATLRGQKVPVRRDRDG